MNVDDLKKTYAWQEALELSKRLAQICEEFSDADTNVLVWHLRQAVIEVPADIATDLQAGQAASMEAVVKLITALQLVNKIYPAIETGAAETALEKLLQRMQSADDFAEREPEPETDEPDEVGPKPKAASSGKITVKADDDAAEQPAAKTNGETIVTPRVDGVGRP